MMEDTTKETVSLCGPVPLHDCEKTRLFQEHKRAKLLPIKHERVIATYGAIELLGREDGVTVDERHADGTRRPVRLPLISSRWPGRQEYDITIGKKVPPGIIAVIMPRTGQTGLRLADEEPYYREYPSMWVQLDWQPCPKCGAPLVWYEAGYVPGYRVCAKKPHHHWRAS